MDRNNSPWCNRNVEKKKRGLTAQVQEKYNLRTALDQRCEQTINRDAKVADGMIYFV